MASKIILSVVVIVYNMRRAAPRSVLSISTPYQRDIDTPEYEVIVVENGSTEPLDKCSIEAISPNIRYFFLENAPPSPAYAINFGVERARGDILAIMIDGAHMLSPRVLAYGLAPFKYRVNPIVSTPAFFLGPDSQPISIQQGYDETEEDRLLESVEWHSNGYRLFDVSVPYRYKFPSGVPKLFWLLQQFESNCLFTKKSSFEAVGGCDLRFDIPGGGCLLPDLCRELGELGDATLVQLLGEASFHQIHGGVSTSVSEEQQKELWKKYTAQYRKIRGRTYNICQKPLEYIGHMPTASVRKLMLTG